MTTSTLPPLAAAALALLLMAGCGGGGTDDDGTARPTPAASASETSQYVVQVNELCDALIDDVVPITGDGVEPTRKQYLSFRPKLKPIWAAFDAKVATVPVVTDSDREAAAAFDAYRTWLDGHDDEFAETVVDMNEQEFREARAEDFEVFTSAPERLALDASGIQCMAR